MMFIHFFEVNFIFDVIFGVISFHYYLISSYFILFHLVICFGIDVIAIYLNLFMSTDVIVQVFFILFIP